MAGLLDMFTNLDPEQNRGLLAAASQMLQASGPQRTPVSFGQVLGSGVDAYQQTTDLARRRRLEEERQAQNDAFNQEYRTAQMGSFKSAQEARAAEQRRLAGREQAASESIVNGQLDPKMYASKLAQFDPEAAIELMRQSAPKPVTYGQPQEVFVKGKPALAVFDNQGNPKVLEGFSPYSRPLAMGGGGRNPSIAQAADKPLPTAALKMLVNEEDALATAGSIQQDLARIAGQIDSGKLEFGMVNNALNTARNFVGMSDEQSRNFASFRSTLEKLRNDSLRLNAGVQTDGDAQRAWNELFQNINDKDYVRQRLTEIQQINARAIRQRQSNISTINSNYGKAAPAPMSAKPAASSGGWSIQRVD